MAVSRRGFLKALTTAGVALPASHWLFEQLEAYANERLAYADVRGPGLTTFSRSVCRDCANHCSLAFRKVDELPVGVRGSAWHPASRGALCPAGQSQMQALFDPDRLKSPLVRDDSGGPSRAIGWDAALQMLGDRIRPLLSGGRGKRVAVVDGRTPSLGTHLLRSWAHSIPGALYVPFRIEAALDRLVRDIMAGAPGGRLSFDLEQSGPLLCVGAEILEVDGSPVTQMRAHGERRESLRQGGAPTIYVGPRQGSTAVRSDLWIPCQPGQERAVVLALADALSSRHPDRSALLAEYGRWVPEAQDPLAFARRYSIANVSRDLDLRRGELENVLKAMVEFGQSVAVPGPGILRRASGGTDARAVLALNLWTNGFREEGGLSWQRDPLTDVAGRLGLRADLEGDPRSLGEILQPLLEIKRSPVDVLICVEANLVHELPGRDQIARALSHIPFVACFATHEDEMSQVSHLTLPTLMSSESWDVPAPAWGCPEPAIQIQRPALVPVVEVRTAEDVFLELGRHGVAGPAFRPVASTSEELVAAAAGAVVSLRRGTLAAADGRTALAEVDADAARKALLSGEAAWSDVRAAAPAGRPTSVEAAPVVPLVDLAPGQLWLVPFDGLAIRGGRVLNRPMMMELSGLWHGLAWQSWVEIHPRDAHRVGVRSGDHVRIRGPRAEIFCRAVVTASVAPGVAAAPVGFGHQALGHVARGQGASVLSLPNTAMNAESGVPAWGPVPVFLHKA